MLPSERLVLAFGLGIAATAYGYWTYQSLRDGLGVTSPASRRAGVALGALLLLALVLRAVARVNRPRDDGEDRNSA